MYRLTANFYPATEPKMGYIGKANISIGNAIRLNGVSVFEKEDGSLNIAFQKWTGKDGREGSYVVPASKEAYAAMVGVVEAAMRDEKHFAYTNGEINPYIDVVGSLSEGPYADGHYAIVVKDFCTLSGISTRPVEYEKDGKTSKFVAVDFPNLIGTDGKATHYTDKEGNERYNKVFEGLVMSWQDKDGKEKTKDFGSEVMERLVLSCRKKEMEKKNPLDKTLKEAQAKTGKSEEGKSGPVPVPSH